MLPEGVPAPSTDERGTVEAAGRTEDIDDAGPKLRRALRSSACTLRTASAHGLRCARCAVARRRGRGAPPIPISTVPRVPAFGAPPKPISLP